MSATDNPLKQLITDYASAFAEWLLGRTVQHVRPLNVEFPSQPTQSDLLFEVSDKQGQLIYLHIELQGRSSHTPMPLRQLEYMSRIIQREMDVPKAENDSRLHSVVIYVGAGAGRNDTGHYQILGLGDQTAMDWQYQVIRLWEMPATTLLQLKQPAFWTLIGQTKIENPHTELPKAISQIRVSADAQQQDKLLKALVALLRTEEAIMLINQLIESDDEFLNPPFMQLLRQEGVAMGLREAILAATIKQFNPLVVDYQTLEGKLKQIQDAAVLQSLLLTILDLEDMPTFLQHVEQVISNLNTD